MPANHAAPLRTIGAMFANVSTLLISVGQAAQAGHGRVRRAGPRRPAAPLDRRDQRGLLPAHERAGAQPDIDLERELGVQHGRAEVAVLRGLADRLAQPGNGERVLRAAVDVAGARPDRVGRDRHALEHPVRVALEHGAVHERAGIALVRVADHDLGRAGRLGDGVPLEPGRVPGAAPAAQAAGGDLVAHLGGRPRGEHLAQGLVAAVRDGVLEALGVHEAGPFRDDPDLAGEERRGLVAFAAGPGGPQRGHQRLDRLGRDVREHVARLGNLDERAARAQAEAADPLHRDVGQALRR